MTVIAPLYDVAQARARLDLAEDRLDRALTTEAEATVDLFLALAAWQGYSARWRAQALDAAAEMTAFMAAMTAATTIAAEAEAEAVAASRSLAQAVQAMTERVA